MLWDPYYVFMAHSTMQSSLEEETFTRFCGCLFGGHVRQSRSSATSSGTDAKVSKQVSKQENKLSKNSKQQQNKINEKQAQISCL